MQHLAVDQFRPPLASNAAPYDLSLSGHVVTCELRGIWDLPTVDKFFADFTVAMQQAQAAYGCYSSLTVLNEFLVQPQQVVLAFQSYLEVPPPGASKMALVVTSALKKRQVERAASNYSRRVFQSCEEAWSWLLERA